MSMDVPLTAWLNLLSSDITPASVMINDISKYFRNHHAPGAWLRMCEGSLKPQLPGDIAVGSLS